MSEEIEFEQPGALKEESEAQESFEDYQRRMNGENKEKSSDAPPSGGVEGEKDERSKRAKEIITVARELVESQESFSFPGINPEDYLKLKAADEECPPGYTTPTDEIIERMKNEGMKVVFGESPESGNVYILPTGSDDIEMDSISPRHLIIGEVDNGRLKELIVKMKNHKERSK